MNSTITIEIDFPFGEGQSTSPDLSLLRPFRQLAQHGIPVGKVNLLILDGDETPRVLGSICHTPGNRVLFFPGLTTRLPRWQHTSVGLHRYGPTVDASLDHVTLDPDLLSWHPRYLEQDGARYKFQLPSGYRSCFPTTRHGDLVFWFSLSVRSLLELEALPSHVSACWEVPDGDEERRIAEVMEAREGAKFHVLRLHPESQPGSSCYLFASFAVDLRAQPSTEGLMWGIRNAPTTTPMVSTPLEGEIDIPMRSHPVRIPDYEPTVWVSLGLVPALLNEPAIFASYA